MQGTQLIEIRHRSKNHLRLLMFLKRFQVNQVKEQGRYNRCEAWPYFNFKCFSYLHKMELCIIKQACDFGSNLSFQQQKNQIIFHMSKKGSQHEIHNVTTASCIILYVISTLFADQFTMTI